MGSLELYFGCWLNDSDVKDRWQGPLFHRWVPDGMADALAVSTSDKSANLTVWFGRKGEVQGSFIQYSHNAGGYDEDLMRRQAALDGGVLYGRLILEGVREEAMTDVLHDRKGEAGYESVGKRVANTLHEGVSRFVRTLRVTYGQWWLREIERWDSRSTSLGSYLNGTFQVWWHDAAKRRREFMPNDPAIFLTGQVHGQAYKAYISESDWRTLGKLMKGGHSPSVSAASVVEAHRLQAAGLVKLAIVEAVTALELVIEQTVCAGPTTDEELAQFLALGVKAKVLVFASIRKGLKRPDLDSLLHLIRIRNDSVHEGTKMPEVAEEVLESSLRVMARWIPMPRLRLTSPFLGNRRYTSAASE